MNHRNAASCSAIRPVARPAANEAYRAAECYLSEYLSAFRMLTSGLTAPGFCSGFSAADSVSPVLFRDDDSMWRDRLIAIRHTVLSVAEPDQKLFLFQHYIKGRTVEECAEILDISVRTAYRLKKRAILTVSTMIRRGEPHV